MNSGREFTERRESRRYKVKDLAFAKLWSEHEEDYVQDMGKLLDISRKGLALRSSKRTEKADELSEMGIFLSGKDFSVDKISFRIISDIEVKSDLTFNKGTAIRYGIQFEDLTPSQLDKLDYFLLYHTLQEL